MVWNAQYTCDTLNDSNEGMYDTQVDTEHLDNIIGECARKVSGGKREEGSRMVSVEGEGKGDLRTTQGRVLL